MPNLCGRKQRARARTQFALDPLLIAQGQVEGLRMVTSDTTISDHYLPNAIW